MRLNVNLERSVRRGYPPKGPEVPLLSLDRPVGRPTRSPCGDAAGHAAWLAPARQNASTRHRELWQIRWALTSRSTIAASGSAPVTDSLRNSLELLVCA